MKSFLPVFVLVLFVAKSFSQSISVPASPDASSLGKYGGQTIGHYTGTMNYSLPLYNINYRNFKYDISLRYLASGLRNLEESSLVGLKWSISIYGVITRTVKRADDFANPNDAERDIFYYNVNGKTGKFFISGNEIEMINRSDKSKITLYGDNFFQMIFPDGIKYRFEKKENQMIDNGHGWYSNGPSAWYLTEITLENGESVNFAYQNSSVKILNSYTSVYYKNLQSAIPYECLSSMIPPVAGIVTTSNTKTDEVLLDNITWNNHSVKLIYSNREDLNTEGGLASKLSEVLIEDKNLIIEKFSFNYDYFDSFTSSPISKRKRLKLLNIVKKDIFNDNGENQRHQFFYEESSGFPDKYENNDSPFGYSSSPENGVLNKIIYPTGGSTEIEYEYNTYSEKPINGTEFDVVPVKLGIRVRNISEYDHNHLLVNTRHFKYEKVVNGAIISSGKLISVANHKTMLYNQYLGNCNNIPVYVNFEVLFRQNYFPIGDIVNLDVLGYDQVTETLNENLQNSRKIVYYFKNSMNNFEWRGAAFAIRFSVDNGILLKKEIYNDQGNLVEQQLNEYDTFQYHEAQSFYGISDVIYIPVSRIRKSSETKKLFNVSGEVVTSKVFSYKDNDDLLPNSVTDNSSSGNTTRIDYRYPGDFDFFVDRRVNIYHWMVEANMVDIPIETTVSVKDGATGLSKTIESKLQTYAELRRGGIVPSSSYNWNTDGGIKTQTIGVANGLVFDSGYTKNIDKYYDDHANITSVFKSGGPHTSYLWGYDNQYPISEAKNAPFGEVYYEGFEEPEKSLWGENIYSTGSYGWPLVFDGSKSHSGDRSGRVDDTNPGWEAVSHSNKWLKVNLVSPKRFRYSGWVYSNGPVTRIYLFMKRAGETGYYSYIDYISTSEINHWTYLEKDFLVPADVFYMSLRVDVGSLGSAWFDDLRICPSDAEMTTYTYKPLVGMTSMTDAKGLTTHYEYDGFQRLKTVKDAEGNVLKSYDYHYKDQP